MGIWTPGPGPTDGDDTFIGDETDETADGGEGNDTLEGGGGDDALSGGAGVDTAVFGGLYSDYDLTPSADGLIISGPDGTDLLQDIEWLEFSDATVSVGSLEVSSEFRVNTDLEGNQQNVAIQSLSDGGFVVSWMSKDYDAGDYGLFIQRYNEAGFPEGEQARVGTISSTPNGDYGASPMTPLQNGGFAISWYDPSQGVVFQRFDGDGKELGDLSPVASAQVPGSPRPNIQVLPDGSFVVAWMSSWADGDGAGIAAQHFNSDGSARGDQFQVNSTTSGDQQFPSISALDDGGFVIVWRSEDVTSEQRNVFAQRYDASGAKVGAEFQVNTSLATDPSSGSINPCIVGLDGGGFAVAWSSIVSGSDGYETFAQLYNADGSARGNEFRINTDFIGNQRDVAISALEDGGFVATWNSSPGGGTAVYGRIFDASGVPQNAEFRLDAGGVISGSSVSPSVSALTEGGFAVAWEGFDPARSDVFAQRFDEFGQPSIVLSDFVITGDDTSQLLQGGSGNDRVFGQDGNDVLHGLYGDDIVRGESGADELHGDDGDDALIAGAGNDLVFGGRGDDLLRGNVGDDTLVGGAGADFIDGGTGIDLADYSAESQAILIDLLTVNSGVNGGAAHGDVLKLIENVLGTAFADVVYGSSRGNVIEGGAGDDELFGRNGNDILNGGFGNDRLYGGNQADILRGQAGDDLLFGGAGRDILIGGFGVDDLRGQVGDDILFGEGDDDSLYGFAGADELHGGTGDDLLDGSIGEDMLLGGAGDDSLSGGNNNDYLSGGAGNDTLVGGNGADTYAFSATEAGIDTVVGLDSADGLIFSDFGYADQSDALAFMSEQGNNVVFEDQGVTVVFLSSTLADVETALDNGGTVIEPSDEPESSLEQNTDSGVLGQISADAPFDFAELSGLPGMSESVSAAWEFFEHGRVAELVEAGDTANPTRETFADIAMIADWAELQDYFPEPEDGWGVQG